MYKFLIAFLFLSFVTITAQEEFVSINGKAGSFSRMGFGARGISMGNSISAVIQGDLVAYYNPALAPFQNGNSFNAGYSFLSLDRNLNFVSFTRKFEFRSRGDEYQPIAGISIGIINSGTGNIEERDNQGVLESTFSTSENQFFFALANRFTERLSVGINVKFYYYSLYDEMSASGVGFDFGAIYMISDALTVSGVITDLNSNYEWDSTVLYGNSGKSTVERFPLIWKLGAAYHFNEYRLITSLEYEGSNEGTQYIKAGVEYEVYEKMFLRGGIDKFNLSNTDAKPRAAVGFSFLYDKMDLFDLGIYYTFAMEPYSPEDKHIITLNFNF